MNEPAAPRNPGAPAPSDEAPVLLDEWHVTLCLIAAVDHAQAEQFRRLVQTALEAALGSIGEQLPRRHAQLRLSN